MVARTIGMLDVGLVPWSEVPGFDDWPSAFLDACSTMRAERSDILDEINKHG